MSCVVIMNTYMHAWTSPYVPIYKPLFQENKFNTVTVAGYVMQCSLSLYNYAF